MLRAKPLAILLLGLSCGLIFLGSDIRFVVRVRAFDIGMLCVFTILSWHILSYGVRREIGGFLVVSVAFASYAFCNALLQVSAGTAIKEGIQMGFFLIFFLALTQYLDTAQATRLFVMSFLAALWILALYNAYYHVSAGAIAGWKGLGDQKLTHSVIVVVLAALMLSPDRDRTRWLAPMLVFALILMFLSGERKGWIAAAVGLLPMMLISDRGGLDRRTAARTCCVLALGAALIAVVAVVAPLVPYLEKQLVSSVDFARLLFADTDARQAADTTQSNAGRLVMIELAMHHIRENPIFGLGPERFRAATSAMAYLPIPVDDIKGSHNELLRIGAELGLVGLALYAVLNLVIALRAGRTIAAMGHLDDAARLRVRLGVALFVYGFFVNIFLAGGGLNTFFVMLPAGLLFSVRFGDQRATRETEDLSIPVHLHESSHRIPGTIQ